MPNIKWIIVFPIWLLTTYTTAQQASQFTGTGSVVFLSEAPAETIQAHSEQLEGIIDLSENRFAFTMPVNSFRGFNSALQKEHFNEHYLETARFPRSTFTGKIVGLKNCSDECDLRIFAKGKLTIHGITKIVTIPVNYIRRGGIIKAKSDFQVTLSDYNINIPFILGAKISPVIDVAVNVKFQPISD